MIKELRKIIVVDLELTCWEGEKPPEGEAAEIIQIGWAILNVENGEVGDKGAVFIKPEMSKLSEYCTNLTGITPKMLKSGMLYRDACKYVMRKLGGRSKAWAAWGDDREALERQCHLRDAEFPFSADCIDVQLLTSMLFNPWRPIEHQYKPRMPLEKAMDMLKITSCGAAHRADNDAYNTALVLSKLMKIMWDGYALPSQTNCRTLSQYQ